MSGFAGVFSRNPLPGIGALGEAMAARLGHRGDLVRNAAGSERASLWTRNFARGVFRCDVETFGESVVVFDGSLFDPGAILAETGARTVPGAVLEGFRRHGPDWFERLDGSFAIVIRDGARDAIHLVRDRFGQRPLSFAVLRDRILVGSEIKALLADPALVPEVNREAVPGCVGLGLTLGPETLLRGVYKALPGHVGLVRNGEPVRHTMYLRPRAEIDEDRTLTDVMDFVDDSLGETIASFGAGGRRLGVLLSGGVDSTLLASNLTRAAGARAVSFGASGWSGEESAEAERIAGRLGLEFTGARANGGFDPLSSLADAVWHIEAPTRFENAIALEVALGAASGTIDGILTGESGDLFFGEREHVVARWLPALLRVPAPLRSLVASGLGHVPLGPFRRLARHLGTGSFEQWLRDALAWAPQLVGEPPDDASAGVSEIERAFGHLSPVSRYTLLNLVGFWHCWIERMEQTGAAHGIDVLHPFQRNRVLEYALSTPYRLKVRQGGRSLKPALKGLVAERVDRTVASRPKRQLAAPFHLWLEGSPKLREAVLGLKSPDCRIRSVLDPERVDRVLERFERGARVDRETRRGVFALLSLEIWLERFVPVRGRPERVPAGAP